MDVKANNLTREDLNARLIQAEDALTRALQMPQTGRMKAGAQKNVKNAKTQVAGVKYALSLM